MGSFRFLHAADLHLDSPLRGLTRHEGLPFAQIRDATRRALDNLVDLAIAEQVAFIVIAGDLYDGSWKDASTGLYMARALGRLLQHDIQIYLLQGNHDAASIITRDLPLPPGVKRFGSRKPETFEIAELSVALHGQSFANRHVDRDMTPNYPSPVPGYFNIGVLHTSLNGYSEHETYAPCTIETLLAKGYDYWALGHVHERAVQGDGPHIVFPGVLQGRHIRETGPKGATLVEVTDGAVSSLRHVPCDVVRWARLSVDCTGLEQESDLQDAISVALRQAVDDHAEERLLVARLELHGATPLHAQLNARPGALRETAQQLAAMIAGQPAIEKLVLNTTPPRQPAAHVSASQNANPNAEDDDIAALVNAALADPELLATLEAELGGFLSTLPLADSPDQEDSLLACARAQDWRALLTPAGDALLARLTSNEHAS
ncbi:metallophosphoesterase family protein [Kozakia baliensis]|uniref:Uncharacterized protein n=1 Tax=Kozakia baliensis TaxID=153496 RepID=A0A1D8UQM7_9PROT|nr:DNA repair exonuclease [Kozakia baliensis]AOX15847.1 hypothetical protein A0U89_00430 [Kozakia baliensis]GBR23516.1 exonuclease [Kozakia baliensis NRIC 0488]GEL65302.1 metallophosphoesterase [Kozakia baliensis]